MAVGRFYSDNAPTQVGPLILGPYLQTYFDEIKSMNDANDAALRAEEGTDEGDLDKMEIAARERLGQMAATLQEAKSGDFRKTSDLMKAIVEGRFSERNKQRDVSAEMAKARLEISAKYREQANSENASVKKAIETRPDTAAAIQGFAQTANVADTDTQSTANTVESQLRQLLAAESAGSEGSPKYDAMVRDAFNVMAASGPRGAEVAAEIQRRMLPASVRAGQHPDDFWMERHAPMTYEKAQKDADELFRKYGGGGASGSWQEDVRAAGLTPEEIGAAGTGTSTSTRTRGGGESAPRREGGAVSIEGMSPEAAQAFAAASRGGADPYAAMLAAIEAQQAYIDDLAQRRKAAASKRPRSLYPRPNAYTVSPNRMVPDDVRRALRRVGNADPGRNEEWITSLRQSGGNVNKAYEAMGGTPERRFGVQDFRPERYEDEGKGIGVALAADPAKLKAQIAAMPREVQLLFGRAAILADSDAEAAAEAARAVSDDEVKAAFGSALRRASDDPKALAEVINGISALPEDATGEWGYAVRALIDEHTASLPKVGARADEVLRGNLDRLGGALEGAGVTKERRHRQDVTETKEARADESTRGAYLAGRDSVAKALQGGNLPEDIEAVWAKLPESETKRGALETARMARERGMGAVVKQSEKVMGGGTKGEDVIRVDTGTRIETPDLGGPAPEWSADVDALLSPEPKTKASKAPDWSADVDALLE